jgi:AhpD family alkylhydroperoxidase
LPVAFTTQCPYGVEVNTKAAKLAGVSREEISEAAFLAAGVLGRGGDSQSGTGGAGALAIGGNNDNGTAGAGVSAQGGFIFVSGDGGPT